MIDLVLGRSNAGPTGFVLDTLIRTRGLICANSGGGKSYVVRKLAELTYGKVQTIIIDPEGEFSTLREKYGYVLVGTEGETPADVRSADLLAEKLLELNASAICDLYDLKPYDRPRWVAKFITALMNARRELWHPAIIIVDEAHKMCPERGKGESEATEAMLSLATAGRKRGFCPIFATQRLGKLNKDAAAELLNVLIGRTWLDVDRDRAAENLGIDRAGRHQFDETLRTLTPGQFFTMGPAISTQKLLFKVDPVVTSHPEVGMGMKASSKTPTPAEVRALLPKLADLPKHAEEKAKTIEGLQSEIRSLRGQLTAAQNRPPEVQVQIAHVPDYSFALRLVDEVVAHVSQSMGDQARDLAGQLEGQAQAIAKEVNVLVADARRMQAEKHEVDVQQATIQPASPFTLPARRDPAARPTVMRDSQTNDYRTIRSNAPRDVDSQLIKAGARRMLAAVTQWYPKGISEGQVAAQASVKRNSGTFSSYKSRLITNGLIEIRDSLWYATPAGKAFLGDDYAPAPRTTQEVATLWTPKLKGGAVRMLHALIRHRGNPISRQQLAAEAEVTEAGGTFGTYLSHLRTADLIISKNGMIAANRETLFL